MTQINWGILQQGRDPGTAVMQSFQQGRQLGRQRVTEQALGTLARDPANIDALANLTAVAPEQLYRFQAAQRTQGEYQRGENFRSALGDYLTGGGAAAPRDALALAPQPNALASPRINHPDRSGPASYAPGTGGPSAPPGAGVPVPPEPGTLDALQAADGAEVVVQGRRLVPMAPAPRAPGGDGWERVVRADPIAAMKAGHEVWGSREDHLKDYQHVSAAAMRLLSGVHDQDSWDRSLTTARHLYDSYGVPFPDNLPDEYSPESVRDLQMQQLDFDDQIKAALNERKFDWQRQDDLLDNSRADRDTDSRIYDRDERRGLTVRGQNMTDERGRYGISVASADRRRGQDISRDTAIRGQDTRGRRGQGGAVTPAASAGPAPGSVIGGFRFKGGDPANRSNWVKAN